MWLSTKENLIKAASLIFFILHTFYVSYPDEFVNLLGGLTILNGKVPYKNFFDHHMPGAWYLSSILLFFSGKSFVLFRILWAIFQFGFLIIIGKVIKNLSKQIYNYFLLFLLAYPFVSIFFWTHLYLADSLASLLIAGVLWILFSISFERKLPLKLALTTSFLIFSIIFTSLTYIYFSAFLYIWLFYLTAKYTKEKGKYKKLFLFSAAPYFLYLIYLIFTSSFKDFWFSNFVYNTRLYISIPNYIRGKHFNPLKMALTLIFNFHHHFWPALSRIGSLDFYMPIIQALTLASVLMLLILLKKEPTLGILYFFLLSFSAPRSNIEKLKESDYQSAVFVAFSLVSLIFFFYLYKKIDLKEKIVRLTFDTLSVSLVIYSFFTFAFLAKNSYEKLFYIYTQKMPRIYDKDYAAEFIDSILEKEDYFWIGPYEPNTEFFAKKGKLPGKYPTLLPQFRENEYLKQDFLSQFEKNPPKIIIFKHTASIFMTPATEFGKFFLDYLKRDYKRLAETKNLKVIRSPSEFNLKDDLYIHRNYLEEIINTLEKNKYLIVE